MEQLMGHVREEIGGNFKALRKAVCGDSKTVAAGIEHDEIMKVLFQQSHHEILQVVRKTDQDFKAYKSSLKSL